MADFKYVTFDGRSYTCPNAPAELLTYSNYIVCNGSQDYVVCFDKVIECKQGLHDLFFNGDNGAFVKIFQYSSYYNKWYELSRVSISNNHGIVSCSESLLPYQDLLLTYRFSIELLEEEVIAFALQPIVEEINERESIVKSSFTEVFSILPVLIVVLISIIGIKKSISFLLSQMRKC